MQGGLFYLVMVAALGAVGAFHIRQTDQSEDKVAAGGVLRLTCTANNDYEYCSWTHRPGNRECHLEWKLIKVVSPLNCNYILRFIVRMASSYKTATAS